MRRKNNKLLKIILVAIFLVLILSFVSKMFNSTQTNNQGTIATYIDNHTVEHTNDTSTLELNTSTSSSAREKYTKILGNNQDEVTLMIYMIGSDLESGNGAATRDINEMLYGEKNDNINIVIQTGGCKRWANNVMSNNCLERYTINSQGLLRLETNIKDAPMTDPDTLTSFIKYSADNFPANRYMLILWDHGSGSIMGYGYDEKYPNNSSMSPDKISAALRNSDIKFDFVAFDACLMANLETAVAIEPYADYLIGSEETEPADGWNYKYWISTLDSNTSIPTIELAKQIIDDYVDTNAKENRGAEITQSIIDLGELVANIKEPLIKFSEATKDKLNSDQYQEIGNARGNTKEFSAEYDLGQVDLIDLAKCFNVDGSTELINAIKSAVKYNKTENISDSYGLSAYFPYSSLTYINDMVEIHKNINMEAEYSDAIKSFASIAASGQIVNNNSYGTSIFDILMGNNYYTEQDYTDESLYDIFSGAYGNNSNYYGYDDIFGTGYDSWFNDSYFNDYSNYFRSNHFDPSKLNIEEINGQRLVSLSDDQWNLINEVTLKMFIDDGEGFIDLGKDNTFDWTDSGKLIVDSDGTWLSVDEHVCAYYLVSDTYISDDEYKTVGIIPAYLNDKRVNLVVNFTNDNPYGIIIGAKKINDNGIIDKGLTPINDGDEIKFVAQYYKYDGSFVDEYQIGDTLIVNGELELNNIYLDNNYLYTYCFKDVYGNEMYTPKTEVKK